MLSGKPYLIGIAGPSGAGKTTLARALAADLGAPIISLESYYRELAESPIEERAMVNFDEPDALDQELLARQGAHLAAGIEVAVPVYDFSRHTRTAASAVRPARFVIAEGLFALYWREVRAPFGTKVFTAAPDGTCFDHAHARSCRPRGKRNGSAGALRSRRALAFRGQSSAGGWGWPVDCTCCRLSEIFQPDFGHSHGVLRRGAGQ